MKEITTEQLVLTWQETKDNDILKQIMDNMRGLIYQYTLKYNNIPYLDEQDLESELSIALLNALKKYDINKGAKFSTFCCRCFDQHMNRLYRRLTSKKRFDPNRVENSYENTIENHLRDKVDNNGDLQLTGVCMEYEEVDLMNSLEQCGLTDNEYILAVLITEGYKAKEIAEYLGITPAGVTWLKKSLRKRLEKMYVYAR